VIRIPTESRAYHENRSHLLLSADDAWSLLLWYRLSRGAVDARAGRPRPEEAFIVLSHITSDALVRLARKHGVGVVKTWVGFGLIANAVERVWSGDDLSDPRFRDIIYQTVDMKDKPRSYNVACLEQSNGFSILGGPPATVTAMGRNGHVRDKDGVFAAILLAEVAAYAASLGTTVYELIDELIYLDPDIGYFATDVDPEPRWGEFRGLEGLTRKIGILRRCAELGQRVRDGASLSLDGLPVRSSETFVAGKYADAHQWPGFPDEGIRFYFDEERLNHMTVRPSGTSQCFRFHIQLKAERLSRDRLAEQKQETRLRARRVITAMRKLVM
jgi:phosphomannomutase